MAIPKPVPTIPFTEDAYEKMRSNLKRLKQERIEIMERLKTAREMGDLSENGAYKYAKFELGNVSRQLRQIQHLLDNGYVKKGNKDTSIDFGSTVSLTDGKQKLIFTLVSEHESDLTKNKLSMEGPLGKALMGKVINDTITVEAPSGNTTYTITGIS